MKIDWNSKYNTIATYTIIVVCTIILFYLSLSQVGMVLSKLNGALAIMQPFIIGFSIAYLLNFILKFIEEKLLNKLPKKVYNKVKGKGKRGISLFLTYIFSALMVLLFVQFVLPQVIESIIGLVNDVPIYINNTMGFLDDLLRKLDLGEEYLNMFRDNIKNIIDYVIKFITNLLPVLGGVITKVASRLWNIILGIIISIYLLIEKERFIAMSNKVIYAIFSKKISKKIIEIIGMSNDTFGKFLSGKILDSIIIGILTFIVLSIFKMPYTLLVSVIVGITNIIPFFGPFIGAVPSFIIILFEDPIKACWFLLIILIIQQIDGNIIGPKILGDSIGISAFWILFSILVAGKFLGLVGMIIGVPLFAIFYSIIKEIVEGKLLKKGLPKDTEEYMKKD